MELYQKNIIAFLLWGRFRQVSRCKADGENIARGQTSAQQVTNAWMNSPGHRANILNEDFTHIGVGYVEEGNYWTQIITQKKTPPSRVESFLLRSLPRVAAHTWNKKDVDK